MGGTSGMIEDHKQEAKLERMGQTALRDKRFFPREPRAKVGAALLLDVFTLMRFENLALLSNWLSHGV